MSVETTTSKMLYKGDGLNREWPVPFAYNKAEHLKLVVRRGYVEEEISGNYRVEVNDSGDTTIIYPVDGQPLLGDATLAIYRQTPQTQIVDLQYGGAFSPKVLENDGFDRLQMQIQEMQEHLDRAIAVPLTDEKGAPSVERYLQDFQEIDERAGKSLVDFSEAADALSARVPIIEERAAGIVDASTAAIETAGSDTIAQVNAELESTLNSFMRFRAIPSSIALSTSSPAGIYHNNGTAPVYVRQSNGKGGYLLLCTLQVGEAVMVSPVTNGQVFWWLLGARGGVVALAAA